MSSNEITVGQTVWVTNWALDHGVEEAAVECASNNSWTGGTYVHFAINQRFHDGAGYVGDTVFVDRAEAVAAAKKMIANEIDIAEQRIARLSEMRFE